MLTKRTNVLLSEEDHAMLYAISKKEGKTIGELIRSAIKTKYKKKTVNSRKKAFNELMALAKHFNTDGLTFAEFKKMRDYGRK